MTKYMYILGTIVFTVYGQIILKMRISHFGELPLSITGKIGFLIRALFDPFILSGFLSAFVASLFWILSMTKFELSNAYPIIVGGLAILTSLLAILIFKEEVSAGKVIGIICIIIGIFCINAK